MQSLGRLAILTEELALKYSPIIQKALSGMQQADTCQPDSLALPETHTQSKTGDAASDHVPSSQPDSSAAAEAEAETAAEAEPDAKAVVEETRAAEAEPNAKGRMEDVTAAEAELGAVALLEGTTAGSAAGGDQPDKSQTTGHKGSPTSELQALPRCMQAVHNRGGCWAHSLAACASPQSSSVLAAAAITRCSIQAATEAATTLPASMATAVAASSMTLISPPATAPAPAKTAATAIAATAAVRAGATASVGAKAAAREAEAVVLEAVSAAAAMVEAFPHLLDDLGDALANGLRCAIGELFNLDLWNPTRTAVTASVAA